MFSCVSPGHSPIDLDESFQNRVPPPRAEAFSARWTYVGLEVSGVPGADAGPAPFHKADPQALGSRLHQAPVSTVPRSLLRWISTRAVRIACRLPARRPFPRGGTFVGLDVSGVPGADADPLPLHEAEPQALGLRP